MADPFSGEPALTLINLRQRYEAWIEAERTLATLLYYLRRKKIVIVAAPRPIAV